MSPRTTAPARRRARSFRLGETQESSRGWVLPAVIAFVVGAVVFGLGGYLVGRPAEEAQMAADIRAADAVRDKEQIKSLTDLARATSESLTPVVAGMAAAPASPDAATWQQTVAAAAKTFDDPPSGSTATNVARGGLATAVDQLAIAVDAYVAGDYDLAERQSHLAVTAWSVGATQLDQINVDAGYGHQHVFLEAEPGGDAFTPDSAPEGHGHR